MPPVLVVDLAFMAVCVILLWQRLHDRRRLRVFAGSLAPLPANARDRTLHVAGRLFAGRRARSDPVFFPRVFGPLGATPSAVIRHGGCCSGTSRLLILTLADLGIRAHQIMLYHQRGHAQHCLVEALLPDGPLIADPSYGFWYAAADGTPIGLEDLQAAIVPTFHRLPLSEMTEYPPDTYYDFDFAATKTVNWTRSAVRRIVYRLLNVVTFGSVDRLRVPALLEWPQTLFILVGGSVLASLHVVLLLVVLLGSGT